MDAKSRSPTPWWALTSGSGEDPALRGGVFAESGLEAAHLLATPGRDLGAGDTSLSGAAESARGHASFPSRFAAARCRRLAAPARIDSESASAKSSCDRT